MVFGKVNTASMRTRHLITKKTWGSLSLLAEIIFGREHEWRVINEEAIALRRKCQTDHTMCGHSARDLVTSEFQSFEMVRETEIRACQGEVVSPSVELQTS